MSYVPVHIKPHLVAFFFREMEGEEINYLNNRAKSITLAFSSSLNKFLRISLQIADIPVKLDNYRMLLSISDKNIYKGSIYKIHNGNKHFLSLPEEINNDINNLLEDIFRIAFVYYILGRTESGDKNCITPAIYKFIENYDLFECGFDVESLRRYFYREVDKDAMLTRLYKKRSTTTTK